ncbi:hypothetical protein DC522_12155 [Microvirga sp. KLBC 81]|nr:hypothetical protein DC522_12155 [Microvirga sp. KLBC 81]
MAHRFTPAPAVRLGFYHQIENGFWSLGIKDLWQLTALSPILHGLHTGSDPFGVRNRTKDQVSLSRKAPAAEFLLFGQHLVGLAKTGPGIGLQVREAGRQIIHREVVRTVRGRELVPGKRR